MHAVYTARNLGDQRDMATFQQTLYRHRQLAIVATQAVRKIASTHKPTQINIYRSFDGGAELLVATVVQAKGKIDVSLQYADSTKFEEKIVDKALKQLARDAWQAYLRQ